jgi:hypothetical protein
MRDIQVSTVYTFAMQKFVYIQVHGADKPLRIEADRLEEQDETMAGKPQTLALFRKDKPVGKFNGDAVDGWWIQDD